MRSAGWSRAMSGRHRAETPRAGDPDMAITSTCDSWALRTSRLRARFRRCAYAPARRAHAGGCIARRLRSGGQIKSGKRARCPRDRARPASRSRPRMCAQRRARPAARPARSAPSAPRLSAGSTVRDQAAALSGLRRRQRGAIHGEERAPSHLADGRLSDIRSENCRRQRERAKASSSAASAAPPVDMSKGSCREPRCS